MTDKTAFLNKVSNIIICDYCLDGLGGICHTAGCIFCRSAAPDIAKRKEILLSGGRIKKMGEIYDDRTTQARSW